MDFLKQQIENFGLNITDEQLDMFKIYMDYLLEYNSHTNLTSITNPEDIMIKHFLDSIALRKFIDIPSKSKVIDVGTGAGFPGVPLKICDPTLDLTLLDGLNKRVIFLKNLLLKLGLDANVIHGRAEEYSLNAQYRQKFDFIVSRAVAPLRVLSEYCLPYIKCGGFFIALKGPDVFEELDNASNAIKILGGEINQCLPFNLPLEKGKRNIVIIQKKRTTPKIYPRKNSKIVSSPL